MQPKKEVYRAANIQIKIEGELPLRGYFDSAGLPKIRPQDSGKNYRVVDETESPEVLRKQIERIEKKTGQKVEFDIDSFGQLPYDIAIPVSGTGISFIKRRDKKSSISIVGLTQPIPFVAIARIALLHLAGLDHEFSMKDAFDPLKRWILKGGENSYVLLHTNLKDVDPRALQYVPFHYVRICHQHGALSAIICLFGTLKFLVFLADVDDIHDFNAKSFLDYYHMYDIEKREIIQYRGPSEIYDFDTSLLRSVTVWGRATRGKP